MPFTGTVEEAFQYAAQRRQNDPEWQKHVAAFPEGETVKIGEAIMGITTDDAVHRTPAFQADPIARPNHYARYAIEPITFIMANDLPFCVGNVVKYVLRYDAKNGREDLMKARRYIDMILEDMDRKEKGTQKDVVGRPL